MIRVHVVFAVLAGLGLAVAAPTLSGLHTIAIPMVSTVNGIGY